MNTVIGLEQLISNPVLRERLKVAIGATIAHASGKRPCPACYGVLSIPAGGIEVETRPRGKGEVTRAERMWRETAILRGDLEAKNRPLPENVVKAVRIAEVPKYHHPRKLCGLCGCMGVVNREVIHG